MNRYRPTFWEFILYWDYSEDDPLSIFLTGVLMGALAIVVLVA